MSKRHHYIPACYLGRFSSEECEQVRLQRVHVARFTSKKVFFQKADQVGAINHFYRIQSHTTPLFLEEHWQGYEAKLTRALDELEGQGLQITPALDASTWLRTLVPFVTGLLVRGPDFNRRHHRRLVGRSEGMEPTYGNLSEDDNANLARIMELQRLISGVIAAEWRLIYSPERSLITSDLGFAIEYTPATGRYSYVVPVSPKAAVEITARRQRNVLLPKGVSGWTTPLGISTINAEQAHTLNISIAKRAADFIAARTREEVEQYAVALRSPRSDLLEPGQLGFPTGRLAVIHEFEWHRLTSILQYSPGDSRVNDFSIDWDYLGIDWFPNPVFPTNLRPFPTGLEYKNQAISLTLFDIDGFSINNNPESEKTWFVE